MSIPTNRWYIKDKVTIADRTSTFKTLELADNNFASMVVKADAEESSVYQIILKDSLAGVAESDLYDPSRFDDDDFVSDLRSRAALAYLSNKGIDKSDLMFGTTAAHENLLKLAYDATLITKRFYIDTGAASAGALISFQVYLISSIVLANAITDIAFREARQKETTPTPPIASNMAAIATPARPPTMLSLPTEESWVAMPSTKRFPVHEHLPNVSEILQSSGGSHLSNLALVLKQAKTKNDQLEEKYEIDFDSLAVDIKEFQNIVEAAYNDQPRQALWTKWAQVMQVAPNELTAAEQQKWLLPVREGIEYQFNIFTTPETGDIIEFDCICAYLPPQDEMIEAEEKALGYNYSEQGVIIMGKEMLNETYNTTVIFLIYQSQNIWQFLETKGHDWDIDEFVENFIRPIAKKRPKPLESVVVSNTTTEAPDYKSSADLREEILTTDQKVTVHKEVLEKYNQVGDPNFINILRNDKNIKNMSDIYKYIVNVVPLDSLLKYAADCLQKHVPELDLRTKVCDTIMRNLSLDQLDKALEYMDSNPNEALTAMHDEILLAAETSIKSYDQHAKLIKIDGTPTALYKKHIRMVLRGFWRDAVKYKDMISLVIFNALDEALSLLSSLDSSSALEALIKDQFAKQKKAAMKKLLDEYQNQKQELLGKYAGYVDEEQILKTLSEWSFAIGAKGGYKKFDLSRLSKMNMPKLIGGAKSLNGVGRDWGWEQGAVVTATAAAYTQAEAEAAEAATAVADATAALASAAGDALATAAAQAALDAANALAALAQAALDAALAAAQAAIAEAQATAEATIAKAEAQAEAALATADNAVAQAQAAAEEAMAFANSGALKEQLDEMLEKQLAKIEKDIEGKLKKRLKSEKEKALAKLEELTNPASMLFDALNNSLMGFNVTSITGDMVNKLGEVIVNFVDQVVTQMIMQIVEEIAFMCEASSKADFANMNVPDENTKFPADVEPVYPLEPTIVNQLITDPSVYDDINDFLRPPGRETKTTSKIPKLSQEFLDDLGKLLTLSEICALMNTSSGGSATAKKVIYNKVWFGILSLEHYAPLKKSIRNIGNLKKFFFILSAKVSKRRCVEKLNKLENTKKLLSNLCGPMANKALVNDLKGKATDAAIAQLLKQEDEIVDNLLDAMHKVKNSEPPPLFCGPWSDNKDKKPVFKSQQHASEKFINDKFLNSILGGITTSFEKDVGFYKSILTTAGGKTYQDAAKNITSALAGTYELKNMKTGAPIAQLNAAASAGKIVAPKVHATLASGEFSVDSFGNPLETSNYVRIIAPTGNGLIDDKIDLTLNFQNTEVGGVPPKTSRLEFGSSGQLAKIDNTLHTIAEDTIGPDEMFNQIVATFDDQNDYDVSVKDLVTFGVDFYAILLKQIIIEHAEYVSTQGLFQKNVFDKLALTRKNVCDPSLLGYKKLLKQIPANAAAMECKVDIKSSPTAFEIAQINGFVELSIKVVVIQEFLKSLMIFSAFGIEALLPEAAKEDSFYYKYLDNQIFKALRSSTKTYLQKFSRIVYAVNYNKKIEEVTAEETAKEIIGRHIIEIQAKIADKLAELPDNTDYNKNIGGTDDTAKGVLEEEFLQNLAYTNSRQIMRNLVPTKVFRPPEILEVDFPEKLLIIPDEYYSSNERLKNGGFFIEEGIEVIPKWKGDTGVFVKANYNGLANGSSPIAAADPNDPSVALPTHTLDDIITTSPIGKYLFLTDSNDNPAYKLKYEDLTEEQIIDYSTTIGKLPKSNIGKYTFAFWDKDTILAQYNMKITANAWQYNLGTAMTTIGNRLYKKFRSYKSLNILIPVAPGSVMEEKYNTLKQSTGFQGGGFTGASHMAKEFYDAVLNKKYFVKEGISEGGKLYFKLPILTQYGKDNTSTGDQSNMSMDELFNAFQEELNAPMFPSDPNSITIGEHLQAVYVKETIAKKTLETKLDELDKQIKISMVHKKDATIGTALPGENNDETYNKTPNLLKDKRGIWGIINSRPTQTQEKWQQQPQGIYPKNHSSILPQAVVRQFINTNTGERYFDANHYTARFYVDAWTEFTGHTGYQNNTESWVGNTIWKKSDYTLPNDPDKVLGTTSEYRISKNTNMALPTGYIPGVSTTETGAPQADPWQWWLTNSNTGGANPNEKLHNYWNGKFWIGISPAIFATKLQEIWGIMDEIAKKDEDGWWDVTTQLTEAYKKHELLKELLDMKVEAVLSPDMYGDVYKPEWKTKSDFFMFVDADSPSALGGWNAYAGTQAWKSTDVHGVQWFKRTAIQKLVDQYSKEVYGTNENGEPTYNVYGLAFHDWTYQQKMKSLEVLINQALFDVLIPTLADDQRFKDFTQSIQYKSLLSFLSILVAETIEGNYGQLKTMFKGTLNAVETALNTLATTANRSKDPEFYQKIGQAPGEDQPAPDFDLDFNWMPIIWKAFYTTMADMTDPTWTTPWFWPGPMTPVGVIAKILDGAQDQDKPNSMAPAELKNPMEFGDDDSTAGTKTDSEECEDEEAG